MRKNLNMKRIKSTKQSLDAFILSKALAAKVVGGAILAPECKIVRSLLKTDNEDNKINAIKL
jgi:hypothetical protein